MLLRTLGGLTLEGARFSRPKPLLLLTYLALEGARDRPSLAELFWLGSPNPRNNLGTAIAQLRRGAPGVIEADRVRVWTSVPCDATELLTAAERGAPSRALELYGGLFLEGFDLVNLGIELEEWVFATREYLAARARWALVRRGEDAASRGEFRVAAEHAERAYLLRGAPPFEPVDFERTYALLVAGESSRAAELRKEAEEYGVTLDFTEEEVRAKLLEEFADVDRTTPHNLPSAGTSFIGRDLELVELAGLLSDDDRRLVTVLGTAGVGKTRLALQAAQDQLGQGSFRDGIYLVRLEALTDPALIPVQVADAVGLHLRDSTEPLSQVTRFIEEKHMLLLLDNYEHLIEGAPLASELVVRCPNLTLLVTSRERLNLRVESVYALEGLVVPEPSSLEEAQFGEAVQLFVERAKSADLRFSPAPESLPDILRICRLVDGSPLGIELSAVWVRLIPPADIAGEIERNLDFLVASMRDVPERHQSIRAAFEHSWRLLTAREQEVLRRLSVFRGGFRREAASEVTDASIPVLASLVDKSLIKVLPNGRHDRHPLLHEFTREKLAEHPREAALAREHHGTYFTRFVAQWGEQLRGPESGTALLAIEEEHENIRVAWRWVLAHRHLEELQVFCMLLPHFYERRDRFREGADLFEQGIAELMRTERDEHAALGYLLVGESWLLLRLGEEERSLVLAQRGVNILRPLGETRGMILGLLSQAFASWTTGHLPKAQGLCEEAVALARQRQDPADIAECLTIHGWVEFSAGKYHVAEAYEREALAIHRASGDQPGAAFALNPLGLAVLESGRPAEAKRYFQEALRLARESGAKDAEAISLGHLGRALFVLGDVYEAKEYQLERLGMVLESGNPYVEAWCRNDLSRVLIALGEHAQAETHLLRSVELASSSQSVLHVLTSLRNLAELRTKQGRPDQAVALASFVAEHPGCEHHVKRSAHQLLGQLRDQMPGEVFIRSEECGKASSLEDWFEGLLQQSANHR